MILPTPNSPRPASAYLASLEPHASMARSAAVARAEQDEARKEALGFWRGLFIGLIIAAPLWLLLIVAGVRLTRWALS